MAKAYSCRCLVLSKRKLRETDNIITLLAQDGHQIGAVAKGVRKPGSRFGARLEPFSEVDLLLHPGRSLDVVSEVRTVTTNASCREDLDRSAAADVIAEFLLKASRDAGVGERIYALSSAAFDAIGRAETSSAAILAAAHLLKAMAMMGVRPIIHECAVCGDSIEEVQHFDLGLGGSLCPDCSLRSGGAGNVDPVLVAWVDVLLRSTFQELTEIEDAPARELLDFSESWLREHLSLNLRSFSLLKSII